jgi:hypothetical protein
MTIKNIAAIRLLSQQVAATKFKSPAQLAGWMGAMQAQDFYMSKWAIGVRLPCSSDKTVQHALDTGEVIRTHVLRPTWHIVSPEDLSWMLELSAPQVKSLMKSMEKKLELSESVYKKSHAIIEKALSGNNHLSREELVALLGKAKIVTNEYRSLHILMRAELDQLICSGRLKDKKQTYALFNERIQKRKSLHREEALASLAKRYFRSHEPATLADFTWWSGLPAADARHALELVKKNFISEDIGGKKYWMTDSFSIPENSSTVVYLLPAFDEYLISYKDRSASLPSLHHSKSILLNGIFKPIIVVNGEVKGLWKRTIKKDRVLVEADFFKAPAKNVKALVEKAALKYGEFLEKAPEVIYKTVKD